MREIKFKVYCEKHNREEIYTLGDLIMGRATTKNGEGGIFENWRQYTGLHDKNGKEIYEGDIISNGYEKSVVVWIKEQAGFMLKLINEEYKNEEWTNPMIDLRKDDEVIRKYIRKSRVTRKEQ